jgi:hypothetical protein
MFALAAGVDPLIRLRVLGVLEADAASGSEDLLGMNRPKPDAFTPPMDC